ncbi:MAG: hypothetical protein ABEJ30_01915 [Halorientalis sp.]
MPPSSARRGQVEPLVAIVAVFALGVGLSLYGGAVGDALPGGQERGAQPSLDRVERRVSDGGVVRPTRLSRMGTVRPAGHRLNVTLTVGQTRWQVGPTPPGRARRASARVAVRTGPGEVRAGELTVRVWR